ncbi:MAG TPA: FAD-dependent oxidoreductase [Cyclobacteriaceae bacterium]|nr:FAD-dependent oxidoreductase [Cyclobacteriaceae bacterium]
MRVDYIIAGFGLAGAALALGLRKRGQKVMIFDQPSDHQASRVAAGLFNPVTGKVMNLTWNAGKLFPKLHEFYREAEEITNQKFFHPKPVCIPFLSIEEQNSWMIKTGMDEFLQEVYTGSRYGAFVNDRFGGAILMQSGFVDTVKFLEAVKNVFVKENSYILEKFDADGITREGAQAKAIIFCEGTAVLENPLFSWVPIRPLKGETLEVKLQEDLPFIFNRGVYLVPQGENSFLAGSTYSHDLTPGPTEAGMTQLTQKLDALLTIPYTLGHHNWGIRPTTPDRKPVLGQHPEHKNVWIFNGLGTKGVSLAPWCSGMLSDALKDGLQIDDRLNITRFYALYSKFRD